jgi:ethanolamine utilization protein EutQ
MPQTRVGITHFTDDDVQTWYQAEGRQIFVGDVLDSSNSETVTAGFARYAPGQSNEWVVAYDEALIVTRGAFSVASEDGRETTAGAGELIFLRKGTRVLYSAKDAGAELAYVTYPHSMEAQQASEHAAFLETFHPVDGPPPQAGATAATDNIALMQGIWGPLERGESHDFTPFYDALAPDVVLETAVGDVRTKQGVIDYFANASATIEFQPFEKPLEYYGDHHRVVILGDETFKVKETGVTHEAAWAWVMDVHDGLIARIVAIQDLSGIAEPVREAIAKTRAGQMP